MATTTFRIEASKSGESQEFPASRHSSPSWRYDSRRGTIRWDGAGLGLSRRGQRVQPFRSHLASQCAHQQIRRVDVLVSPISSPAVSNLGDKACQH